MNACAMLVLLLTAQAAPEPARLGQVITAQDKVCLQRDGFIYQARFRDEVQQGDRIWTTPRGGACFFIEPGVMVYLGASTRIATELDEIGPTLHLEQGELRIVNEGKSDLLVTTPDGRAAFIKGILNVAVKSQATKFWSESGTISVWSNKPEREATGGNQVVPAAYESAGEIQLLAGEKTTLLAQNTPTPAAPETENSFQINPDQMQLRGAEDASQAQNEPFGETFNENFAGDPNFSGDASFSADSQPASSPAGNDLVSSISLGLGGLFGGSAGFNGAGGSATASFTGSASGGYNGDAGRVASNGPINAVTAQAKYTVNGVKLNASEQFDQHDFSIGVNPVPTTYVDGISDATGAPLIGSGDSVANTPGRIIPIPKTDAYLVELNVYDKTIDPAKKNVGIDDIPFPGYQIGAFDENLALRDTLAKINDTLTYAFGELRVLGSEIPQMIIRRSDDDRDRDGNLNPDLTFLDDGGNKVPTQASIDQLQPRRIGTLDMTRKAAVTTLMADQFQDYARRTGQTRFVIDGKIIDISGYK